MINTSKNQPSKLFANSEYDMLKAQGASQHLLPLLDQLVLVGGCATELLVTDKAAPTPRPTQDVDMIIDVLSLSGYHDTEANLRDFGFTQTMDDQGLICRWIKKGLILDLIPTNENILGFTNRRYTYAIQHS